MHLNNGLTNIVYQIKEHKIFDDDLVKIISLSQPI